MQKHSQQAQQGSHQTSLSTSELQASVHARGVAQNKRRRSQSPPRRLVEKPESRRTLTHDVFEIEMVGVNGRYQLLS